MPMYALSHFSHQYSAVVVREDDSVIVVRPQTTTRIRARIKPTRGCLLARVPLTKALKFSHLIIKGGGRQLPCRKPLDGTMESRDSLIFDHDKARAHTVYYVRRLCMYTGGCKEIPFARSTASYTNDTPCFTYLILFFEFSNVI